MASITITPLNNGITPAGGATLAGMITLNAGTTPSYVYYDTLGIIYYQVDAATPATILLDAGFAIACIDSIFDGTAFSIFMGGAAGNYIWGSIDPVGVSTLAPLVEGTEDFTSATFNTLAWGFTVGTATGKIFNFDLSSGVATQLSQLAAVGLPNGATLKVSSIKYDLASDKHLIACTASTNVNPDYSDPVDVAAKALTNFSAVFYGTPTVNTVNTFVGKNLGLCASGWVENSEGLKVPKLVVAGEDCKIHYSDDGVLWKLATVDQAVQINSLTFNTWVFAAGLPYGIVVLSTNGAVWESSYDALLASDIIDVKPS